MLTPTINTYILTVCLFLLGEFKPSHLGCPFAAQFQKHGSHLTPESKTSSSSQSLNCGGHLPKTCSKTKYRSYDGSCNNLKHPGWGVPQSTYSRLLPPNYSDGLSKPPVAKSGNALPNARAVSFTVYPDVPYEDKLWTLAVMQYGQFVSHDMSLLADNPQIGSCSTHCCTSEGKLLNLKKCPKYCLPILIPCNDPVYAQHGIECMNFIRTFTDRDRNCVHRKQPAEQLTVVNHYLDLSAVYGNDNATNVKLRKFQGGLLKFEYRQQQEWLPRNTNASTVCTLVNPDDACYLTGDSRANQNPQLTVLHTILLREHNRLAKKLSELNPHWNDEKIFQEARKINIAQHQRITYYELLPIFIGLENAYNRKILWNTTNYVNDYNPDINVAVSNEHATAAYRFFHTLIAGKLNLDTESRSSDGALRLSDWFDRPAVLEQDDNFDKLTRGLASQQEYAADVYHDSEITLNWQRKPNESLGLDLKAICIERNRDHGLASYNDYRHYCGLSKATVFEDFADTISKENIQKLASLYEHPDDVDLTVGGSMENIINGTLSGPTFTCILTEQFYRTRVGDQFWFENKGEQGFTLTQLNEIRKATISRLLCDNAYNVKSMQPRGFDTITTTNAVVSCESLPVVNLTLWKE